MKIGITLDMSKAFWANGLQQNIVFLYELLERIDGVECLYITPEPQKHPLGKKHKGVLLKDFLVDNSEVLDVLIVAGFDLLPEMLNSLRSRNPRLKVILLHYGNKLMDDIHHSVCGPTLHKTPLDKPNHLSEIWISPQHSFGASYISAYYNHSSVKVAPYIWDPFFIQSTASDLKKEELNPFFTADKVDRVCIFEPNISFVKSCIVPVMMCEHLEQVDPGLLKRVNVFCCEKLRKNPFFDKLMNHLRMVEADPSMCYFNNRWGTSRAIAKFGGTIVSHQLYNDLNYIYFEALYLGLPLIHNSETLMDYGYYYPDCDVHMGALQIKNAILNHSNCFTKYKGDVQKLLHKYSPYNLTNISIYQSMLESLEK